MFTPSENKTEMGEFDVHSELQRNKSREKLLENGIDLISK